jgi:outer membrane protein
MKKVLLCFSLVITCLIAEAQSGNTPTLPEKWSLADCIDYAVKNNITLSTLRLNNTSAQLDLDQSKNNRLPAVAGSVSQNLGNGSSQSGFSSSYGVNASLTLYNGGYLKNNIKAGELSLQSANLTLEETANDITLTITQAYLNILLSLENIKTLEELQKTSETQLSLGKLRYDKGSISRKDYLQFESQLAADNFNLVNAGNSYRSNIATLKQILQLPTATTFEIETPSSIEPQEIVLSLPQAQQAAAEKRPEVKNKEVAIQLANTALLKTRASLFPTISLGAGLSSGYSSGQQPKYVPQLGDNFYQTLGVTASIPIFSRKQTRTNISKSKIVIEQSKLALENTKTVLNQQVEQAYISLQNAQAQFNAAATQLKIAEETYKITNEQLRLGSINMTEVLQQKNSYVQVLQSYMQAKYMAVLYNKIYKFYTGEPVTL